MGFLDKIEKKESEVKKKKVEWAVGKENEKTSDPGNLSDWDEGESP